MLLYLQDYKILLFMTAWLFVEHTLGALKYGARIQPLRKIIPLHTELCGLHIKCNNTIPKQKSNMYLPKRDENFHASTKRVDTDLVSSVKEYKSTTQEPHQGLIPTISKATQTSSAFHSQQTGENDKRGASFFFTQVEPHRFEYRAMFQHHKNQHNFEPFVHHFDSFGDFPPLPKFPPFPEFPDFFQDHKDPFPNFPGFSFPTLPPSIKRAWLPPPEEVQTPHPILDDNFDGPLIENYDGLLSHKRYPKIFRFNEERINIEDFDKEKKLKYLTLSKSGRNEVQEHDNVKREQLLILHGGVFTVQEPPLYNKHLKKIRRLNYFHT
ncbi:uncharacterized protein LOC118184328 [Stegodyphus dumicola]|uniref:uncharacterized protein LOC118184328 n=1 Tax=Stegodyphus dumicola TaxID=202533 RepID=UPI0015AAC58D|nr:uncharacterized protein LOC118184328 [Stegodyphus dumicola]